MINPISANSPMPSQVLAPTANETKTAPVHQGKADSVQISLSAQVKQLSHSGVSISEISVKTGLDAATVKNYLGK